MNFGHPLALCWLALSIPIVWLYLRKAKIRREVIATGMFWDQVLGEQAALGRLRRLREPLSLAMQLLLLTLMTLALAEPRFARPELVVLIVDNSGANAAPAKRAADALLKNLHEGDWVAVLSAAPARAHCGPTNDRELALKAVASIPDGADAAQLDDVLTVAGASMGRRDDRPHSGLPIVVSQASPDSSAACKAIAERTRWVWAGNGDIPAEVATRFAPPGRPVWFFLAGVVAALLAIEWRLYHRRLLT